MGAQRRTAWGLRRGCEGRGPGQEPGHETPEAAGHSEMQRGHPLTLGNLAFSPGCGKGRTGRVHWVSRLGCLMPIG